MWPTLWQVLVGGSRLGDSANLTGPPRSVVEGGSLFGVCDCVDDACESISVRFHLLALKFSVFENVARVFWQPIDKWTWLLLLFLWSFSQQTFLLLLASYFVLLVPTPLLGYQLPPHPFYVEFV